VKLLSSREQKLKEEILLLKKEKDFYIIAHYYQRNEVQDIADFVGDSYMMAVKARDSKAQRILVAGVDFMAETAAILCPNSMILTPEPAATCPMANTINTRVITNYREHQPNGIVVCYVNTPAKIKALSDICCTSSNALKIIKQLPKDSDIFFIPDEYLGLNIARELNRPLEVYSAHCPTHKMIKRQMIDALRQQYPEAVVMVHPECNPEVVQLADYVGSTKGMVDYASTSPAATFIVGTEGGILYSLQKANPDKEFILATDQLICPNMKSITLDKIKYSLEKLETRVKVPEKIRSKAERALNKMIEYSS
jgi:quinolinate synthase